MRLLLVEDSVALVDELLPRLKQSGYAVDWVANGHDAAVAAFDDNYDIAVLDLGLPGRNGLDVLREWRAAKLPMPVLVLTARDSFADRIDGLRAGADDYLAKPFHAEELLLRLQALLRRQHGLTNAPKLHAGVLTLDEQRQCVSRDGVEVMLGGVEFRLLRYFMLHPGQLLSRGQLEEHLYDGASERDSNVLEVHINRLRRKLGRDVIETRRGQGYRFIDAASTGGN